MMSDGKCGLVSETSAKFDMRSESCHDFSGAKAPGYFQWPLWGLNPCRPGGTFDGSPVIHCRETGRRATFFDLDASFETVSPTRPYPCPKHNRFGFAKTMRLSLLSGVRMQEPPNTDQRVKHSIAPKISIVIPVHNCKATIAKCLGSISRLDHPSFEIIVVDDGSTDDTAEICESFAEVTVIRLEKGGPSRARNTGIESARGEFVAFTDGDCLVDEHWLQDLEKGFTGPLIAGVGGDQKSPEDDTEVGKRIQRFLKTIGFVTGYIKTDAAMKATEHNPSCNSMYRKAVLKQVGGFDEALWPGEDVELDLKITTLGHTLIYNPHAVVSHYRPRNYADFGRMMLRYGACQWYLVRKYGFFRRIQYVPIFAVLGLGFLIAVLAWDPEIWPIVLLPLPLLFGWFYIKTLNLKTAFQFACLMVITLVNWHWGFFTGWARFRQPRRERRE